MSAVGFDVGNENSYVASVISGGIEILDNEYSLRATPTYVAFTESSRNVGVGAKAKVVTNLENTIFGFKRLLGKNMNDGDVKKELEYLPHVVVPGSTGDVGFEVHYLNQCVQFSSTQIMGMFLTKLKMIYESKAGNRAFDCVIAVPERFTDVERRAMLDATKIADLKPLKLLNEMAAVALAYGFYRTDLSDDHPLNVVFIDIGHSCTTAAACRFTKDKLKILGTVWNSVGGRDFDNVLVKHFADEFREKYKIDVFSNKKALMILTLECESLKRQMSMNSLELFMNIECFMKDLDVKGRMRRSLFEKLSAHLFTQIEGTILSVLSKTKLNIEDVHSVEIVGGSTRIPAVKQLITKIFGREPNSTLNQDEAVARGCALQCALLSPALKTRKFTIEDAPSYDIQVTWKNMESVEEELCVFDETYEVPAYRMITFPMSRSFEVNAYQIDRFSSAKAFIGSFSFGNFPTEAEGSSARVKAKAGIDVHGIFNIFSAKVIVRNAKCDVIALPEKSEDMEKTSEEEQMDTNGQQTPVSCEKSFSLSVTAQVPQLPLERLREFVETEKGMIQQYLLETEKADARNALEERVYELRSKLNEEFKEFVQDQDRNKFLQYLDEQENWIFDGEGRDAREFSRKLKESEQLFEPVFRRYKDWEQRPKVVAEFQEALQSSLDQIEEVASAKKICFYVEDVQQLQNIYGEARSLYNRSVPSFANARKCEDSTVTTDFLRKCLNEFQREFRNKYAELKNKIASETDSNEVSGDGNSAKEENAASKDQETPKDS